MTMMVASGTSTPTSMTVVDTRQSNFLALKSAMTCVLSFSFILPCSSAKRTRGRRARSSSYSSVTLMREPSSSPSILGQTK